MKNTFRFFCLAFLASGCALVAGDLTLWYQQPAAPGQAVRQPRAFRDLFQFIRDHL